MFSTIDAPIFYAEEYIALITSYVLPIILLGVLIYFAWKYWIRYVNAHYISEMKWSLMEIKIPKDVFKSPLAMELVFNALYQTGGHGNWLAKFWQGGVRSWFSLEIASIEGHIHFFIRTQTKFKAIIESQIYAQYPQAEVAEVDDYTRVVPPYVKDGPWEMSGTEFILAKEDPYPIKTYIDFGLDQAVGRLEEAERIDPITSTLEYMGSIGAGEQIWFQIIVRAAQDRWMNSKGELQSWQKQGRDLVSSMIKKYSDKEIEYDDKGEKKKHKVGGYSNMPPNEKLLVDAIERSISKLGFDVGIRAIYIGRKEKYNAGIASGLGGILRQYTTTDFNSFKGDRGTGVDFPWEDLFGTVVPKKKSGLLKAYRLRGWFYHPFNRKPYVLNTEELATIFHFPGRVLETPSFQRIDSKKVDAPANLPL